MKKERKVLIGVAAVFLLLFIGGAFLFKKKEAATSASLASDNAHLLVRPYSPVLGLADARVTIVEFFDPECEACRAFHPIVKSLLNEYQGKVRLVARYMPFHQNSVYAATILEATRPQGKYWETLEAFFERQPQWASHQAPRPELLLNYLDGLGVDPTRVKESLESPEIRSRIDQDREDGTQLGVKQTPSFFINGKPLQNLTPQDFKVAIEAEL